MKISKNILIGLCHVVCWITLFWAGLAVFRIKSHQQADQFLATDMVRNADASIHIWGIRNELAIDFCEINALRDESPCTERQLENSLHAQYLFDTLDKDLLQILPKAMTEPAAVISPLKASVSFWDSLVSWIDMSQYFDRHIWLEKTVWQPEPYAKLFKTSTPEERQMLLQDLRIRSVTGLNQLHNYNSGTTFDGIDRVAPTLLVNPIYPNAGEKTQVEIFLSSMIVRPSSRHTRFWVNNREILPTHRQFLYTETFPTPGPQPLHLRAELRDPRTQQVKTYERDYILNVRPKK